MVVRPLSMSRLAAALVLAGGLVGVLRAGDAVPARLSAFPKGALKLIDEIDAGKKPAVPYQEFPENAARVEKILGAPCRVLVPTEGKTQFFAYRIGKGKKLAAGKTYVLAVEYPEDAPRALLIHNWGADTISGFATGSASGDAVLSAIVPNHPESLDYPLSGRFEEWTGFFSLHDRFKNVDRNTKDFPLTPDDGFWVVLSQLAKEKEPLTQGVAVRRIRLYEVANPDALALPLHLPPAELPRRRIFWREEMSDGIIGVGHKPEEKKPETRGVNDRIDWYDYKFRFMKFIGIDTYAADLLEFGHNQGWDSTKHGGNDWIYQAPEPDLYERYLQRMKPYGFAVLPYFEYAGSIGGDRSFGRKRRAERLDNANTKLPENQRGNYTQIHWTEKANVDLGDPETRDDIDRILDITVGDAHRNVGVEVAGVWLRPRPAANPVGFSDAARARFAEAVNDGRAVTRAELQKDKALRERYYQWWFGERRRFLEHVRDRVRADAENPRAFVLYTTDATEPGAGLGRLVADDPKRVEAVFKDDARYKNLRPMSFAEAVKDGVYRKTLTAWSSTWGAWEWNHASPPADPEHYNDAEGVMLTRTMNRLYSVSNAADLDAFRTQSGLAVVHHHSLNEHEHNIKGGPQNPAGYFLADVERAGPYCMAVEARAMAEGDPSLLGYLYGNSIQRGFPEYVRRFNQAFLSLPALPSTRLKDACPDKDIVVREIRTPEHGTWYAVVNNGFAPKKNVTVTFPARGRVTDAAVDRPVDAPNGRLALALYPFELRAFRVQ